MIGSLDNMVSHTSSYIIPRPYSVKLQIEVYSPSGKKVKVSEKGNPLEVSTGALSAKGTYTVRLCADDLATVQLGVDLKK